MPPENESRIEQLAIPIAQRAWERTEQRRLTREEKIDYAVKIIDRVNSIIRFKEEYANRADELFNQTGAVAIGIKNHKAAFFYEFDGEAESLIFGIKNEVVMIKLKHGKTGGLEDASIKYVQCFKKKDFVHRGLEATQRANGLADRFDMILNGKLTGE